MKKWSQAHYSVPILQQQIKEGFLHQDGCFTTKKGKNIRCCRTTKCIDTHFALVKGNFLKGLKAFLPYHIL